jgi:hypothetical protein
LKGESKFYWPAKVELVNLLNEIFTSRGRGGGWNKTASAIWRFGDFCCG